MIVDLIILLILGICIFLGYKKGFIVTFFNMFAGLICFTVSLLIAKPVGRILSKAFIRPLCFDYFENAFQKFIDSSEEYASMKETYSSALEFFGRYGIKSKQLQSLVESSEDNTEKFIDQAIEAVSNPIADAIGFLVAFVAILILVCILYKLLVKLLELVSKLPLLNASNKTLGIVCGLVHGLVLSVSFSCVLYYVEPLIPISSFDFSVENTFLAKLFTSFLN